MKTFLFIAVLIVIVAGYIAYQNPQVHTYLAHKAARVLPTSTTEQTMYRWVDKHGELHVSDKPPQGIKYQTVHYPTDANVIPSSELTGKN